MEDQNSDDWLPPGWTVQVRARKDGKRDKYYIAPSSGLRFSSKPEVLRYLKNTQSKKASMEKIVKNVVIEKGIAEGLPPGWIRKTRVTEKGDKTRRDSYYIDPVSGYAFRSLKDVDRYLTSGKIGRNAFKPKADESIDIVSGAAESTPLPERSSSQCLELKEEMVDIVESASISTCADGVAPEKQLPESAETKSQIDKTQNGGKCKQKRKKETNLPRRASKRLAGIKADPVPELVKFNRARQVAVVKQSGEEESITCEDNPHGTLLDGQAKHLLEGESEAKPPESVQSKHSYGNLPTPEKLLPEKIVGGRKSDKDKNCISALPLESQTSLKDHVRDLEAGDKVDIKDYSLGLPLQELLTDPCIAFAIQTLTGIPIETPKNSQMSSDSNNSKHCETSAEAEEHGEKIKGQNLGDKANENSGSSSELQLGASWMDPCIDFAIKTLTGAIPFDSDQNIGNCLQQPLPFSSERHCDRNRMAVSSINMNNLCQNDYYCTQYYKMQKPLYGQQPFMKPALPNARNVGVGSSVGVRLPHCGEDRKNGWQR